HDAALRAEVERDQLFFISFLVAEASGEFVSSACLFLDRRQLDVAHVSRLACFPEEVELHGLERNVGVNRAGVGLYTCRLDTADNVDSASLSFYIDFGSRGNGNDEIDPVLFAARTHV